MFKFIEVLLIKGHKRQDEPCFGVYDLVRDVNRDQASVLPAYGIY